MQRVGFEVPGLLQEWWDLWVPFTAAIHWPAWAAVFSLWALLNTVRIADRGRRDARSKQATFLQAVANIFAHASAPARSALADIDRGEPALLHLRAAAETERVLRSIDQLNEIKATDFESAAALDEFLAARGAINSIANQYIEAGDPARTPDIEFLRGRIARVDEAMIALFRIAYRTRPFDARVWFRETLQYGRQLAGSAPN